jgi:hypothetical protein
MTFYMFWKNSNFRSKSVGAILRFYQKSPVWGINCPKHRISWSWPPYNGSVIHNGFVYVFLQVLKNSNFLSKSIGVSLRFHWKTLVWGTNWSTLLISWSWHLYYGPVIHNGPKYDILLVFEKFKVPLKIHVLPYGFTENR